MFLKLGLKEIKGDTHRVTLLNALNLIMDNDALKSRRLGLYTENYGLITEKDEKGAPKFPIKLKLDDYTRIKDRFKNFMKTWEDSTYRKAELKVIEIRKKNKLAKKTTKEPPPPPKRSGLTTIDTSLLTNKK